MEKYSLQRISISLLIIATLIFLNTIKGIAIPSWYLIASIGEWKNENKLSFVADIVLFSGLLMGIIWFIVAIILY